MAAKSLRVEIPEIKLQSFQVYLIGTAPLIVHAFPEKARKQMLDKQMKQAKGGRDARDPQEEFEAARYFLPDGRDGFPAVAFKATAVTACTSLADITKVEANGVIDGSLVRTALIPIISGPPTMREDVARLSGVGRTPEMRYRPEFFPWGVEFEVILNPQVISFGQLGSMFQAAGHGVGVGDYRPERDGDCGTFDFVTEDEFKAWRVENGL